MGYDLNIQATGINGTQTTGSINGARVENEIKVFGNTTNPISNSPVYTDADFAEMWLEAGLEPSEAPEATATVKAFGTMELAGIDLMELDEMFADEPDVVAHTLTAFQNGSASRIERENQAVGTLIENLPEGTTEAEFEAFMYAFNS